MDTTRGRPSRPRWRRLLRWFLLGIPVLVLGLMAFQLGVHLYVAQMTGRELREAVAETDRADPDWRLEQLEERRQPIRDEQNAALRVLAIRKLLPKDWPPRSRRAEPGLAAFLAAQPPQEPGPVELLTDLEPQVQLNEEQSRALDAVLKDKGRALEEAAALSDLPDGRYPIAWKMDFMATLVPEVEACQTVAVLLRFGALRRAQEGDAEGACRQVLALANTGRSLGEDYSLVLLVTRMAVVATATQVLERVLAQGEPGDGSLVAIQQLLEREEAETSEGTVTALRGERALVHRMMDAFESGALSFTRRDEKPSLGDRLNDALNANMVRHSHAVYLRYMNKAIQVAQVPPPERRSPLVRLPAAPEEEGGLARLAILFIPSTKKVLKNEALKLAHLRCAIAAVALERYRRAHGRWPESLEAVAPEYLPEWPSDPFDGEPIRCRRRMDGVALYSVGPDGVDEGGAFDRQHPTDPGSDVGFRLWDVAYRRQPASPRPTTRDR